MAITAIPQVQAKASEHRSDLLVEMVDSATGEALVADRYIAVVDVASPWREPVVEAVLEADEPSPRFSIPRGRYRVVCGAVGFGLRFEPPVDLDSAHTHTLRCGLSPLATARGRVMSHTPGEPVSGAVIAPKIFFVEESPLRLSLKGMEFAARNFVATTDAEGRFVVAGERSAHVELWVEAEGFALRSLGTVGFQDPGLDLGAIEVEPGGGVRITARRPPDFPARDYLIALRPIPREEHSADATLYQALMRPLDQGEEIRYRSLPPGEYEVWLKPRIQSGRAEPPLSLAAVVVREGTVAAVEATLPDRPPVAPSEVSGAVSVFAAGAGPWPIEEMEIQVWRGESNERMAAVLESVSGGLRVRLPTDCSRALRVQLVADGLVTRTVEFTPEECAGETVHEIEILPAALVRGKISVPLGHGKPKAAELVAAPCGEFARAKRLGSFTFAVDPEGAFSIAVPAGCLDLSLVAEGFAPATIEGLDLTVGRERDLGVQRLLPGAILLVRSVSGSDRLPAAGVELDLLAEEDSPGAVAATYRRDRIDSSTALLTDDRGWARFEGVPAGTYRVRAADPGGMVTFSLPVGLQAAVETVLEIEIPAPATVEVSVEIARDTSDAGGHLRILATGAGDCDWLADALLERTVEPPGTALFEGMHPGTWSIILQQDGPSGRFELAEETIELLPGSYSALTLTALGHVFSGEITWLDEPVEGSFVLRSRGPDSPGRTAAAARSREDGEFRVVLTEPGIYDVEVQIPGQGLAIVSKVSFEDPDEWIRVVLGGGAIEGFVLDADGQPVTDADVHARLVATGNDSVVGSARRTEADGSFRVERLNQGRWQLRASAEGGQSKVTEVPLTDREVRSGVVLTLDDSQALHGRVEVGGRPLAGAVGWVDCLWTGFSELCGGNFRTQPTGEFRLPFGDAPEGALVNILVEGNAPLGAFRVEVSDRPVTLSLAAPGGRVTLSGSEAPITEERARRMLLIDPRGGIVPAARGVLVAPGEGGRASALVFPNLAPGVWSLIEAGDLADLEILVRTGGAGAEPRAVFELAPGASVEVPVGR